MRKCIFGDYHSAATTAHFFMQPRAGQSILRRSLWISQEDRVPGLSPASTLATITSAGSEL